MVIIFFIMVSYKTGYNNRHLSFRVIYANRSIGSSSVRPRVAQHPLTK